MGISQPIVLEILAKDKSSLVDRFLDTDLLRTSSAGMLVFGRHLDEQVRHAEPDAEETSQINSECRRLQNRVPMRSLDKLQAPQRIFGTH